MIIYSFSPSNLTFSNLNGSQTGTLLATRRGRNRIADFDGDARTDISIWQSDSGKWQIINSLNTTMRLQFWGRSSLGDLAVPGDYDGDGKTDVAVFRPVQDTRYIIRSMSNTASQQFLGGGSDVAIPTTYLPQ